MIIFMLLVKSMLSVTCCKAFDQSKSLHLGLKWKNTSWKLKPSHRKSYLYREMYHKAKGMNETDVLIKER